MELIIGKTAYKTNEYLFTGKNSAEIIAESNIKYLTDKYKNLTLHDLNYFIDNNNSTYLLNKDFEKEIKRPGIIILQEKDKDDKILFLRDDLFFKLNNDMKKDPVLDYSIYTKLENTHQYTHLEKVDKVSPTSPKFKI